MKRGVKKSAVKTTTISCRILPENKMKNRKDTKKMEFFNEECQLLSSK